MLARLNVSTRLAIGFGAVVALLITLAAMSIVNLVSFDAQVELLARVKTPLAIAAGRWESGVLDSARHMRAAFAVADAESVKQELAAIPPVMKTREEMSAQVHRLADTDKQRSALQRIDSLGSTSIRSEEEFLKLTNAGRMEEAHREMLERARPAEMAYIDAIHGFVDLVEQETRTAVTESDIAYRRSLVGISAVAGFALVLAIAVTTLISRSIRQQLGGEPAEAVSIASKVAQGDLTVSVRVAQNDRSSLMYAIQQMVLNLRSLAGAVVEGAHTVADSADQIAQGNTDLSQRTEEQASTLEETASQMEELTSTVTQNAANAAQASQLATQASRAAAKGGEVVSRVVSTMSTISASSTKIADIIGVIDGIAFQTNILALNAAVEAARAGEQGRGFAVVASEVRNLAQRSAAAAKEIKTLIGDSVSHVEAGTTLVSAAGAAMQDIVTSVTSVSELIAEIAAASGEQSAGIEQVNTAVTQMDHVVQQNASLVEEATAATESMKSQAAMLLQVVARFNLAGTSSSAALAASSSNPVRAPVRPIAVRPVTPRLAASSTENIQPPAEAHQTWREF